MVLDSFYHASFSGRAHNPVFGNKERFGPDGVDILNKWLKIGLCSNEPNLSSSSLRYY